MAGIYKIGFKSDEAWKDAVAAAINEVRRHGDKDPFYGDAEKIQTPEHLEAGEYLVRLETMTQEALDDMQVLPGQEPHEL